MTEKNTTEDRLLAMGGGLANTVLGGLGLFCIMLSLYYFYYYSWTKERRFTGPAGVILYEVFPAVLAGLLLACLRLRPSRKVKLALFLFSTGVSIYGAELSLSMLDATTSLPFDDKPGALSTSTPFSRLIVTHYLYSLFWSTTITMWKVTGWLPTRCSVLSLSLSDKARKAVF